MLLPGIGFACLEDWLHLIDVAIVLAGAVSSDHHILGVYRDLVVVALLATQQRSSGGM